MTKLGVDALPLQCGKCNNITHVSRAGGVLRRLGTLVANVTVRKTLLNLSWWRRRGGWWFLWYVLFWTVAMPMMGRVLLMTLYAHHIQADGEADADSSSMYGRGRDNIHMFHARMQTLTNEDIPKPTFDTDAMRRQSLPRAAYNLYWEMLAYENKHLATNIRWLLIPFRHALFMHALSATTMAALRAGWSAVLSMASLVWRPSRRRFRQSGRFTT